MYVIFKTKVITDVMHDILLLVLMLLYRCSSIRRHSILIIRNRRCHCHRIITIRMIGDARNCTTSTCTVSCVRVPREPIILIQVGGFIGSASFSIVHKTSCRNSGVSCIPSKIGVRTSTSTKHITLRDVFFKTMA